MPLNWRLFVFNCEKYELLSLPNSPSNFEASSHATHCSLIAWRPGDRCDDENCDVATCAKLSELGSWVVGGLEKIHGKKCVEKQFTNSNPTKKHCHFAWWPSWQKTTTPASFCKVFGVSFLATQPATCNGAGGWCIASSCLAFGQLGAEKTVKMQGERKRKNIFINQWRYKSIVFFNQQYTNLRS